MSQAVRIVDYTPFLTSEPAGPAAAASYAVAFAYMGRHLTNRGEPLALWLPPVVPPDAPPLPETVPPIGAPVEAPAPPVDGCDGAPPVIGVNSAPPLESRVASPSTSAWAHAPPRTSGSTTAKTAWGALAWNTRRSIRAHEA